MSDAETVERVARAMWESRNASKWADAENTALINIYRGLARAALAAMPSPTVQEAAKVLLDAGVIGKDDAAGPLHQYGRDFMQEYLRALTEQEGE